MILKIILLFLLTCFIHSITAEQDTPDITYPRLFLVIFSGISIPFSLFIFIIVLRYRRLRTNLNLLALNFCGVDLIFSITNFLVFVSDTTAGCRAQGFFFFFLSLSRELWAIAMFMACFSIVVMGVRTSRLRKRFFIVTGWFLPLLVAALFALTGNFGPNIGWCWISLGDPIVQLAYFAFIAVLYICFLIGYFLISRKARLLAINGDTKHFETMKTARLYIFIFFITRPFQNYYISAIYSIIQAFFFRFNFNT